MTLFYARPLRYALILAISMQVAGCGLFGGKKAEDKNPLIRTECPETLPPLRDGATFGDSNLKIVEVAGIYFACRKAALTGVTK